MVVHGSDAQRSDQIAQRQQGLFTRAQARGCGYSDDQARRLVRAGVWRSTFRVLRFAGREPTPQLHDLAAHLSVPDSVLAGPSTARWWGMDVHQPGQYLALTRRVGPRRDGIRTIHTPLPATDVDRPPVASR